VSEGPIRALVRDLRLQVRVPVALVSLVLVVVALLLLGVDPVLDRLVLLALLGTVLAVLVWELVPDRTVSWQVARAEAVRPAGQDRRTASWVRHLEAHQRTATPDGDLRERLAGVVEDVVLTRHGAGPPSPEAEALLRDLRDGPPRRLRPAELRTIVERIEQL
jgi:hypothetical protein